MIALIKREINSFFSSSIGYLVIALFLIFNGLLLWVFNGAFNILDAGFAELTAFFQLAPWVLLFLIPAVTMGSFSDEKKNGNSRAAFNQAYFGCSHCNGKVHSSSSLNRYCARPNIYIHSHDIKSWKSRGKF